MRFDRSTDPSPLPAQTAVSRGTLLINVPVWLLMLGGSAAAYFLSKSAFPFAGVVVAVLGWLSAWLWWSWFIPQWRTWAHSRGAEPEELQALGEEANLTWPKGSFFERTEIRRNGR